MSIPTWIIVGMIACWMEKRAVPEDGPGGILENLIIGVVGALAGGWVFCSFGRLGDSSVGAFTGAVISLWILRALTRSWARVQA
ncbi:MAG: GlsB/YeaQ/YmgE family stress response membrane protein [bacterium]|nr:GlsB/YeaQ/YmgE family stress response membrane protein [bacterium]